MSSPPSAEAPRVTTACPHCGKRVLVRAEMIGKQGRCPGCSQVFRIAPAEAAAAPAQTATTTTAAAQPVAAPGALCGICQTAIGPGEASTLCPDCRHPFHAECWQYNQGCAVYGCGKAPPTVSLTSLEIPASYWGREDKNCPNCGQKILAAAVRCRFCGAQFSSATPQSTGAFRQELRTKADLPAARTASIWLLVFSLLPCTAPIAALAGLAWFLGKRDVIRAMPPLNSALVLIAIGVAAFQTALMVLIVLLKGLAT